MVNDLAHPPVRTKSCFLHHWHGRIAPCDVKEPPSHIVVKIFALYVASWASTNCCPPAPFCTASVMGGWPSGLAAATAAAAMMANALRSFIS